MPKPDEQLSSALSRIPDGLPPSGRLRTYLDALAQLQPIGVSPLVSIILFGSAAKNAFSDGTSDVDLILVLPDSATPTDRRSLYEAVSSLEIAYGFRPPPSRSKNWIEKFAEHAGGQDHSCFICTRSDLLSGDVIRVFNLRPVEGVFVDRIVLASVIVSAVTVSGEDLLPRISLLPIRRLDVFKALFGFVGLALLSAEAFPFLPDATKYAMGALKHSLHSCYFCYHLKSGGLDEEVAFFNSCLGQSRTLLDLLDQRRNYRRSFTFVLRCVPALFRLHLRTAWDNRFPRAVVRANQPYDIPVS